MNFNKHSELEGLHAYLGASKHYWLNYSDAKFEETYNSFLAKERGTKLHKKEKGNLGLRPSSRQEHSTHFREDKYQDQMLIRGRSS